MVRSKRAFGEPSVIRHCVLCRFRDDVDAASREALYERLTRLCDELPNVLAAGFGSNASPEGLGQGFDDGFVIDFVDSLARDAYLDDATHRAIGADLLAALDGGRDGLVVFDLEIER